MLRKIFKKCLKEKKALVIFLVAMILTQYNIVSENSLAYNEELNKNNHAYPVYTVLTLTLNNQMREGIVASTLIWNESSRSWVENTLLFQKIQADLNTLPDVIKGLEAVELFEYNDTFQPGCVYLFYLAPLI